MRNRGWKRNALLCGVATVTLATAGFAQAAEAAKFDIAPQPLSTALAQFGVQSEHGVFADSAITERKVTRGVSGDKDPELALNELLAGTGLDWRREGQAFVIVEAQGPQSGSAAGDGADGMVEALIVTAQKREEDIQDVPIAISAFTQDDLTRSQVAGGPDLMTQVPNMTFTKTNFTSYSIQIRGIGTQAISATTDPAVAVAFNNTPFIRNRFFEQEFYDLQRVEVLRGPQGTLYGRNATAGVVNIISAKPKFAYEAKAAADIANYKSARVEGMVNIPLVEDMAALRIAGAWTKRDGFVTNELTGNPIDGRDLWSSRVSLRVAPTAGIDVNLIWEHFEEDDDRLRSGKQLCNTHVPTEVAGVTHVGGDPITNNPGLLNNGQGSGGWNGAQGTFSQGCAPVSMYAPESFQTPNGFSLPYYLPLGAVFLPTALNDPYVNRTQSSDLRVIESTVDPEYRAKSDIVELQVTLDLTDHLSLSSETAWASDFIFSMQDLNRFNTAPGAWQQTTSRDGVLDAGVFCDPQIGCSDRLVALDLSTAKSQHFSQEFRLASDFDGPFNFSLGTNFLRYDTEDKYYVFINSLSIIAAISPLNHNVPRAPYELGEDNRDCMPGGLIQPDPGTSQPILGCTYLDPNPIDNLNDLGHNYFLSKNPYKLISYAVFGEAYYSFTENLKLTAGLRWTVDRKEAPRIPSWLLASDSAGYPRLEVLEQEWREPTGRLTIDWKPALSFTDETLVYASYARGYKAGGANPPPYGVAVWTGGEQLREQSATNPKTFDAEYVNAFELGAKNTFADGRMTVNTAGFYYDYEGYQISQIVDRSATNLNFDAEVWGLELEADWRPIENLRLGLKLGYENTTVADGEQAIDLMDRTAGVHGWVVVRPFPSIPSNCILPEWLFLGQVSPTENPGLVNLGGTAGGNPGGCELAYLYGADPGNPVGLGNPGAGKGSNIINYTQYSTDPADFPGWPTGVPITDRTYPGWDPASAPNNGQGFFKDLSGKELPNAPHYTATLTVDYTIPLPADWLATLHTDLYYQSEAWTRIFNTEGYDKLKAYTNLNLAAIFTNEDAGWNVMAYVKNVFDRDSITGAFLFSDDVGLTTNVFLTEPRLYGLRVTKKWSGGPLLGGLGARREGPYPFTLQVGGQLQSHDAPNDPVRPSFSDTFGPAVDNFGDAQDDNFDWGDGREARLTWRPGSGSWTVSAGVRYGKANHATRLRAVDEIVSCAFGGAYAASCTPDAPAYFYQSQLNFSDVTAWERESHTLVDFTVGRDAGLGRLSRSILSAGLRFAEFESKAHLEVDATPDWTWPAGWYLPGLVVSRTRYDAELDTVREFEGVGPVAEWEASVPLVGNEQVGHLELDWSVGGGVLFGKHKTSLSGSGEASWYEQSYAEDGINVVTYGFWVPPDSVTPTAELNTSRSQSVTVPTANISLGLSYALDRLTIGAGYRWERYFNVLDGGHEVARDADRTIDGPYFKLSVGFGG